MSEPTSTAADLLSRHPKAFNHLDAFTRQPPRSGTCIKGWNLGTWGAGLPEWPEIPQAIGLYRHRSRDPTSRSQIARQIWPTSLGVKAYAGGF